jgi:hypothetical protein
MPAPPTDSTTATAAAQRRGKSKAPNFKHEGPVSVIRLELDVSDESIRGRVERQWVAVFRLRRALQRDAADRCRAYWSAHRERARDPKALRERLGLTRRGVEAAATKAVGLHVADEVWETIDRHLFAGASGGRQEPPRIGSWWDFTRIPGRARSHTKTTPVWETWRLAGSLDGHLAIYRHPELPSDVVTAADAAAAHGSAPWTAHDATPTRISMGCRRARPHALRAAQHVGWCPSR